MKKIKIAVQNGLAEIEALLKQEGFDVYKYGKAGFNADVTVITGIDGAYEEIQPAQYHANGKKPMLVVDATNSTTDEILKRVHRNYIFKNLLKLK